MCEGCQLSRDSEMSHFQQMAALSINHQKCLDEISRFFVPLSSPPTLLLSFNASSWPVGKNTKTFMFTFLLISSECEHHQLHQLLGGRACLLRPHSPLLPTGLYTGSITIGAWMVIVAIFCFDEAQLVMVITSGNVDGNWKCIWYLITWWSEVAFQAFDYTKLTKENRKQNYELAFQTGE